jgi:threonylcarbamoyladenosine tRNA methylthiotransferase MtaB
VRSEAQALAGAGFVELVLTGIHLTSYGRDLACGVSLADAIRAAHDADGVMRIRLGSLEPAVVTQAFVDAAKALPKLCPQFHLALQSGSDAVLARMKRRYSTAQYRAAVQRIRAVFPDAALTTDVIVGFPNETDAEFDDTVAFVREIGFLRLHVFPFSPREGTPAATMTGQVPQAVKDARVRALIAVGDELANGYRHALLGTVQPVLLEVRGATGVCTGYTPQYVHVAVAGGLPGRVAQVRLTAITKEGMTGELVEMCSSP